LIAEEFDYRVLELDEVDDRTPDVPNSGLVWAAFVKDQKRDRSHDLLTSAKGKWVDGRRTLCEVWREVADLALLDVGQQAPEVADRLLVLAQEGFRIGIAMQDALIDGKLDGHITYSIDDPERLRLLALRREVRVKITDEWLTRGKS
jgi:hypothetical protein